jgi:glutamate synthase (ferredoxin)
MAKLGFRTINEMVGRSDLLTTRDVSKHWKAARLDFSDVFKTADRGPGVGIRKAMVQDHGVERSLDVQLIEKCQPAIERGEKVAFTHPIRNTDRSVGAQLGGAIAMRHGAEGLADGAVTITFEGTAGQSFGAFLTNGVEFDLRGVANDYVCKGLSGGIVSVRPPAGSRYSPEENVVAGNVCLYGATSGKAFFNGAVGERFAVRNSGATTVVEAVGDHGCEYMTGGLVVILGAIGRNFAAGMSGGLAYVYDPSKRLEERCNLGMVELIKPEAGDLLQVKSLIEEHAARTASPLATKLLANWAVTSTHLVKVFPKEYRRVLEERIRRTAPPPSIAPSAGSAP